MAKQIITGLDYGDVAEYFFLCGEPERVPRIASALDNPHKVLQLREYTISSGELENTRVSVASTGAGGPSTAVLLEEITNIGAHTFIRIGTSGGIGEGIEKGDLVISTGAIRVDGTSRSYAWPEFPALAHHEIVLALIEAASRKGSDFEVGITYSVDGFYSEGKILKEGKLVSMSHNSYMLEEAPQRLINAKRMGALNVEMEAGTLFTMANLFKLRAGMICTVSDVSPWHPTDMTYDPTKGMDICIEIGIEAMKLVIARDKEKGDKKFWYPGINQT